jgi:hypothetical protein
MTVSLTFPHSNKDHKRQPSACNMAFRFNLIRISMYLQCMYFQCAARGGKRVPR